MGERKSMTSSKSTAGSVSVSNGTPTSASKQTIPTPPPALPPRKGVLGIKATTNEQALTQPTAFVRPITTTARQQLGFRASKKGDKDSSATPAAIDPSRDDQSETGQDKPQPTLDVIPAPEEGIPDQDRGDIIPPQQHPEFQLHQKRLKNIAENLEQLDQISIADRIRPALVVPVPNDFDFDKFVDNQKEFTDQLRTASLYLTQPDNEEVAAVQQQLDTIIKNIKTYKEARLNIKQRSTDPEQTKQELAQLKEQFKQKLQQSLQTDITNKVDGSITKLQDIQEIIPITGILMNQINKAKTDKATDRSNTKKLWEIVSNYKASNWYRSVTASSDSLASPKNLTINNSANNEDIISENVITISSSPSPSPLLASPELQDNTIAEMLLLLHKVVNTNQKATKQITISGCAMAPMTAIKLYLYARSMGITLDFNKQDGTAEAIQDFTQNTSNMPNAYVDKFLNVTSYSGNTS
jgi:hypothetical protein